ncbi:MAG: DNA polymerase I [Acidobacteria bacterium]|nr:MAG: DNA polymerase I [Acidobacteriota bacterium]REK02666.1 MAG: DNA polymerase I [Acidobacteriota bacterium]REK13529.1 MAG: DNA polymerase I [Acidobacteriota bacterium]REK41523.1 MAG: DNA polymerase I [Acidobacteriota bacterium]
MSDKSPDRVFLIDAMSHIFRAFFAPLGGNQEPMRNSKGLPTQAVFVFTNMLRKLIADENPEYIAAIFDTEDPTFRDDLFEDYKANREEMPEDLATQLPYIVRVCEALNVPVLKKPGYEADDIIGTFAKKCEEKELKAVIVSNDKDLCQLVSDPFVVCMRQNSQNIRRKVPVPPVEWCDEAWVEKKFELPPNKIIDYLGLMGDSVDNIPGAPGIGAKGAVKLIKEFGSAEGAIENADKVSHKTYRESLQNNAELVRQSVELATVHTEVPIDFDLTQLKIKAPDRTASYELFRELEFNTLTREFSDSAPLFAGTDEEGEDALERRYEIVSDRESLDKLVRKLFEIESWSFEIDDSASPKNAGSFDHEAPDGVAIATRRGAAYYVDFKGFKEGRDSAVSGIGDILKNKYLTKSTYDYKRNLAVLNKAGIAPANVSDDLMVAAYLIDSGRRNYELRTLAQQTLEQEILQDIPDGWTETQYRTAERADFVYQLAPRLNEDIESGDLDTVYREIELPLIPILYKIEMTGMKVDPVVLKQSSEHLAGELEKLSSRIFEEAGREFNVNSPKQVAEVLQDLNIETKYKTPTGKISTSKDALQEIGETYEIANHIIEFRELDKLKSTYADSLPNMIADDGRIHGKLNQTVAATGRLSSTDPNLQNIPIRTELGRQIRKAFIAEDGCKLISADYSQLELRILAHITQDEVMLEAFRNAEDVHAKTARLIFGAETEEELRDKRRLAKIVNFGIAYAVEAFGLSQRVGISKAEAREVIDNYYATYKGIKKYMDETPKVARDQGYVSTIFGRRRYLPSIKDRNFAVRSRAEREAINMPIQGTASDIVKIAMIMVDRALSEAGLTSRILMQVHDELLLEAPESEVDAVSEILSDKMQSAAELDVPLLVEIGSGDDWMSVK